MIKEAGCGPEIDSWRGFLPTIPDRLKAQPKTDRRDTDDVAGILSREWLEDIWNV
jgi:hypothetical protein